jgi:hypothetical protein
MREGEGWSASTRGRQPANAQRRHSHKAYVSKSDLEDGFWSEPANAGVGEVQQLQVALLEMSRRHENEMLALQEEKDGLWSEVRPSLLSASPRGSPRCESTPIDGGWNRIEACTMFHLPQNMKLKARCRKLEQWVTFHSRAGAAGGTSQPKSPYSVLHRVRHCEPSVDGGMGPKAPATA